MASKKSSNVLSEKGKTEPGQNLLGFASDSGERMGANSIGRVWVNSFLLINKVSERSRTLSESWYANDPWTIKPHNFISKEKDFHGFPSWLVEYFFVTHWKCYPHLYSLERAIGPGEVEACQQLVKLLKKYQGQSPFKVWAGFPLPLWNEEQICASPEPCTCVDQKGGGKCNSSVLVCKDWHRSDSRAGMSRHFGLRVTQTYGNHLVGQGRSWPHFTRTIES